MLISFTSIVLASSIAGSFALPTTKAPAKAAAAVTKPKTTTPKKAAAAPLSCPMPVKAKKIKRNSLSDEFQILLARVLPTTSAEEFIGWHGTNGETAALWAKLGEVKKPLKEDGTVAGKSVLDAELGSGLYLADDHRVAGVAARANADAQNKALKAAGKPESATAKLCAISAKSSTHWRLVVPKAEIPDGTPTQRLRGNKPEDQAARDHYLATVSGKTNIVLMGPLDKIGAHIPHQIMIPEAWNPNLSAQCFDVNANGDPTPADIVHVPALDYSAATTRADWKIVAVDAEAAKGAKEAGAASTKVEGCGVM